MTHNPLDFHNTMSPDEELKRIGLDLDGTLAVSVYPDKGIGEPIWSTINWVRKKASEGYKIVIFTSRADGEYKDIAKWCRHYGVPFEWIYTGKPLLKYYVDDRNLKLEDLV